MIYRHGDVILKQVKEIPNLKRVTSLSTKHILALGETTGHAHRLTSSSGNITLAVLPKTKERFIELLSPATLTHEEHGPITVQVGVYEILQEREYDYIKHRPDRVVD